CTTATGSFTIDNYDAAYTYTITPSTGVTQTSGTVTAPQGSYTIKATLGSCSSSDSVAAVVNAQPSTPAVPTLSAVTQPTCTTATGSFTIDNYNAAYTYTITPSTGVTQTNGNVTAPEGSYTIKATLGSCSSSDSVAAVVSAQPSTPAVPTLSAVTQPTCATATGTITVTVQNVSDTYSFDNGQNFQASNSKSGLISGTYYVITKNAAGCNSLAESVIINAKPNCAPLAVDDTITAIEDTLFTSTVNLTANDTDVDLDALTVVAGTFTTTQGGTLTLAADGSYTYMPAANFHGTDTVNYTVSDGTLTDIGTLTITVTPVNDAPVAVDDTITAIEDTLFTSTVNLTANDTDIDLDTLTVVAGTFTTAQGGTLTLAADGSYTYMPAVNFHGTDT
ncbi:cadherin-like domain-containing protein, partial [Flavobacterium sp. LC2016-12]|uniref:cadherin-like domain-containing protein n=1 Tax=Flavobacterium sp. LC2016-12 TaxID=2783794 RepID=UPI00188A336B